MTEAEALEAAAEYLATHVCERCHTTWLTGASVKQLWHRCPAPTQRVGYDWRPPRQRIDDERYDWARRTLGAAIEDELGPRAWLDPGEEE